MGTTPSDPYSLLVGAHVISLLRGGCPWPQVADKLKAIGYADGHLLSALDWMIVKGVVKPIGVDQSGAEQYEPEHCVIAAHWGVLKERAYTDNVAISMASRLKLCEEAAGLPTTSLSPTTFAARVELSCVFLDRVREAQNAITDARTASMRHLLEPSVFGQRLLRLRLPDIYAYAGSEYRERVLNAITRPSKLSTYLGGHPGDVERVRNALVRLTALPVAFDESRHVLVGPGVGIAATPLEVDFDSAVSRERAVQFITTLAEELTNAGGGLRVAAKEGRRHG
jgi:hypothetical protein